MGRKTHGPYLLSAIEHNDIHKINEILNSQIRSKTKIKEFIVSEVRRLASEFSEVPLLLAACNDDPTIIKYFVTKHGVNINHVHEEGFGKKKKRKTALIMAVRRGLYATVDAVLALNADANEQDHKGRTALHHAVRKADFRMAKMLCSRGAQTNVLDKANNSPVHIATIFGHMELVKVLIKYGGDLYKKGQHGAIPIHIAAREGHSSLVRLFCQYEVNVNIKVPCYEGQEKAPIHVAAEEGHAETVFALLDSCGADVALRDSEGETPLHCCTIREYDPMGMKSKEDYTDTAKVLLNFGAHVNIQNRRGETPMHLAARNEFQKVVEVLVLAGADPLIEDFDGNKPVDLVFPEDTVTKQILKNAQEEREKYMSEAIEVRAKGFTTSVPKQLPLSMRSQSTMNMLAGYAGSTMNSSMARAASVPGLLALPQTAPAVYEDGYLQPLGSRSNVGPGLAMSQTNTYKSSHSRSTGSSAGSHIVNSNANPTATYDQITDNIPQNVRNATSRDRRAGSESTQPDPYRQPQPLTERKRAQSADRLNAPESPFAGRSLPSPPQERKAPQPNKLTAGNRGVRASAQSDATSFWSVSTYPDGSDNEMDNQRNYPQQQMQNQQPGHNRAAGINKRQAAPLRFLPAGPHGAPEQEEDSDEESYFDDESFDTLDTLSVDEVEPNQRAIEARRRQQEMYEKQKSGSQGSLHEWLEEQAEYLKDRDKRANTGPVAQSTPPQGRAGKAKAKPNVYDTTTDTASEFSEHVPQRVKGPGPKIAPKPVPRDRHQSTDSTETVKRRPPPPLPRDKPSAPDQEVAQINSKEGNIQKVIQLQVDDTQTPGQTIIKVVPITPTEGLQDGGQVTNEHTVALREKQKTQRREVPEPPAEKPKVSKKPKVKSRKPDISPSEQSTEGREELNNNQPHNKKKAAKQKKNLKWQHADKGDADEIYEAIKDSDKSMDSSEEPGPHNLQSTAQKPVPKKRINQPNLERAGKDYNFHREIGDLNSASADDIVEAVEKRLSQGDEEDNSAPFLNVKQKKQEIKQAQTQKRQQMFQEQLLLDQQRQEQINKEQEFKNKELQRQLELQQQQQRELQEQQELKRQQEYQRQQEMFRQQLQQQQQQQAQEYADPMNSDSERSPRRKVTIGSEEIIQDHSKKHAEDGVRNVVYSFDGSMKMKIVGGNAEGVYVGDIEKNSDPALNGLQIGDQILKINGRSIKGDTKEEVFNQLMRSGARVSLLVKERREKCADILEEGGEGDDFFMEALYDHDPSQSGELIIRKGDVFAVKDSLPDGAPGSWKAVKVSGKTMEEQTAWKPLMASKKEEEHPGFIPNIQRAKQIMVKENLLQNKPTNRGGLFTRSFGRSKSADRQNKSRDAQRNAEAESQMIPYRRVQEENYQHKRPVVLLGLFCDGVRQQLLRDSPDFFESPGDVEVPTNMGPVDMQAIKHVMNKNKHCLLILSPKAIEFLKDQTDVCPIVIYLNPVDKNVLKTMKNKLAPDYNKKVNYMFDEAVKFERQQSSLFTSQVAYTVDDSWFVSLKNTIFHQQDISFWGKYQPPEYSDEEDNETPDIHRHGGPARGRQMQRVSRTTDDIPDYPESRQPSHAVSALPPSREESEDGDSFDSDESEEDVDVGMRRPLPAAGTFLPIDPVRTGGNAQMHMQPNPYAQPMTQRTMRDRNRSEGDILQYLNGDVNNMEPPSGPRQGFKNSNAGMQYANTGRYSGDFDQHQPAFNRQPERQSGRGGMLPIHPATATGGMPGYRAPGPQYQAYEYMHPPVQQPQYQRPPMMQRADPKSGVPPVSS